MLFIIAIRCHKEKGHFILKWIHVSAGGSNSEWNMGSLVLSTTKFIDRNKLYIHPTFISHITYHLATHHVKNRVMAFSGSRIKK